LIVEKEKMGTPDEFIVENLMCPACERRPVRVLQTKVLPHPNMDEIRLGGKVPFRIRDGDLLLDIADGRVLCWTSCGGCGSWLNYYAVIKNNTWVGLELASVTNPSKSKA